MEKKTITVHALTVHVYTIAVVILVLALGLLGLKYLHLKLSLQRYTNSTIWMNAQEKPTGKISDYAAIIAQSSQKIPAAELQVYVENLSKQLNRDIVVVDKSKKILADTVPANNGKAYMFDANNEINMTITDGKTRIFEEKSTDYPNGLAQVVVPVKNAVGDITGVVLISNTQLFK